MAGHPLRLLTAAFVLIALLTNGCTSTSPNTESAFGQECVRFQPDHDDDPFFPADKTYVDPDLLEWPTAEPGGVDMDPAVYEETATEVARSPVAASLLVVRHGKLVFERYFNGFDAADAKHVHSLGKSITSVVTGIAIDEGVLELETRIDQTLSADQVGDNGELTVRDLLTMSGGLDVPDPEWAYEPEPTDLPGEPSMIRMVLESRRVSDPGTEFVYSTGLTQVLAAVVADATGMSFCEYAANRLLGPLGIDVDEWHVQPDGYFGAGPTFITPREIARFGQLVLDGGVFEGQRLVSQSWIDQSLTQRWKLGCIRYPPVTQRYGYLWWGYHIGGHDVWIASGSGAQDLAIVPALDLVAVITHKGDRWYAVIYEGLDPATGKELRRWHPAGTSRTDAERLAANLAASLNGRNDNGRPLTFAVYLTARWLPGRKLELAHNTWDGYRRKVELHVIPSLGKIPIRRLRPHLLERLYDEKLHPANGKRPLAPKAVLEIHLIIRGALNDAVRRGIVTRNVALVAHAPKLRSIPKVEQQAWTAQELQAFLREAAGHRLFAALASGQHRAPPQ